MKHSRRTLVAFTLIELLTVTAVVGLLVSVFLPAIASTREAGRLVVCKNNLKQLGTAYHIWAASHGDAFPMRVALPDGGYADFIGIRVLTSVQSTSRGVSGSFLVMSNELSTPRILYCPAENELARHQANTFAGTIPIGSSNLVPFTNDLNTSYFVGPDATLARPRMFLGGDHNLGSDGNFIPLRGFVTAPSSYSPDFKVSLGTNFAHDAGVAWLNTMHSRQGNVLSADGSVLQYDRAGLQKALKNSGDPSNGGGPAFPNPTGCIGLMANRIQFP